MSPAEAALWSDVAGVVLVLGLAIVYVWWAR